MASDCRASSSGSGSRAGLASESKKDGDLTSVCSDEDDDGGRQSDRPGVNKVWTKVVSKRNMKKIETEAKGKSARSVAAEFRGGDGGFRSRSNALPAHARKLFDKRSVVAPAHARTLFDRRSLRPKSAVVINADAVKRSWLEVCATKRKISSFLEMNLVSPLCEIDGVKIADVPNCLVNEAAGRWKHTLVGFVLGDVPFFGQILAWARRSWRIKQEVRVFSKENGFFYFQFGNDEDRDAVLRNGPWLFDGRLVVLQRWGVNVGFDRDYLSSVPVWIRIPHLPLHLWSAKILSIITSVIGAPICLDRATASMDRIAYARCLVEVNAAFPLVRYVLVRHEDGSVIRVEVEYEGEPPRCESCLCFGHTAVQCSAGGSIRSSVTSGAGAALADVELSRDSVNPSLASDSFQGETTGVLHKGKCNGVPRVEDVLLAASRVREVDNDHVNALPLVEEEVLAATRSCSLAHGDVGTVTLQDGDAEPKDTALAEQCNVEGDCCNATVDVAKSDAVCNKSSDDKLAVPSSSAAPSLNGDCKKLELGRKQSGDSGSGISLSPVVDEIGRSFDSVAVDALNSFDVVNGLAVKDSVMSNSVLGSSFPFVNEPVGTVDSSDNSALSPVVGPFNRPLGFVVNGQADLNLDLAKELIGQTGLDVVNVPEFGSGSVNMCLPAVSSAQCLQSSPLCVQCPQLQNLPSFVPFQSPPPVPFQSHGLNLQISPTRIRLISPTPVTVHFPPPEPGLSPQPVPVHSPPPVPVHSPPPVPVLPPEPGLSPPPMPDSLPLPPNFGIGSEVVGRGLNDVEVGSVSEGFNLGNMFLSGSKGDRDASFEFTKINDAWLLEQEDAKQSNVKSKKTNPSLVGTRKSVRFGGGSGPTPPARFRK